MFARLPAEIRLHCYKELFGSGDLEIRADCHRPSARVDDWEKKVLHTIEENLTYISGFPELMEFAIEASLDSASSLMMLKSLVTLLSLSDHYAQW
jgi:hypothetical protein